MWIMPIFYGKDWYKASPQCDIRHLEEVLEGALYIGPSFTNPLSQTGIGGMDASQFQQEFQRRSSQAELYGAEFAPSAYDGVWAVALSLNRSINVLESDGNSKYNRTLIEIILYKEILSTLTISGLIENVF